MKERNLIEEDAKTFFEDGFVNFPTGKIDLRFLRQILNTIPFEIDVIDANDKFVYFTDGDKRMHQRYVEQLGQALIDLHPENPERIRPTVQKILASFKDGSADHYEQWFPMGNRTCYINYYAIRDIDGTYLGCIEFTGDIKRIQGFRGIRTPHNSGKSE